jgi:hypothetical protein
MRSSVQALVAAAVLAATVPVAAQVAASSRGQLLYETHCIECHNAQVHWRDQRQVRDWATLKQWVAHWQREARLDWSEADVAAVAHYLNATIYRFAEPQAVR